MKDLGSLATIPKSDPTSIYRARDGIFAVELLVAAISHLDLFTLLARESITAEELCERQGFMRRPVDVMLTLFVSMGLLERTDGRFSSTLQAREFLSEDSPWDLKPYYTTLKDRPLCLSMLEVLKTGRPADYSGGEDEWTRLMGDRDFAQAFTSEMNCRGVFLGPLMARAIDLQGRSRLLDIGGGSGVYSCAVVVEHPHIHATVLEKPPVDDIARTEVERRGLSDHVTVVSGDMFESLPDQHDVHLYSNVLHDWDEHRVRDLLRRSSEMLPSGGLLVVHDAYINHNKTGPLHVAEYSVLLMHFTEGKCYSVSEVEGLLSDTGFVEVTFRELRAARSVMTARKS